VIVDSSALIAIVIGEPEAETFAQLIIANRPARISGGTWIELAAVITRGHPHRYPLLLDLIQQAGLVIEPVSAEQAQIGHNAYRRFGIGSGHPARLNFGDCFAYALAKSLNEPLLFKGDDFAQTDVTTTH